MRTACAILAGLCWLFVVAAFFGLLFVVFKPRALNSDVYPAAGLYAVSVALGLGSLATGLSVRRQSRPLDLSVRLSMAAAAAGLLLPAMLVLAILRAG